MEKNCIVILDNIRSALNVGAIFRTCSGAGVNHLYLVGITPYPPHPKVLKTALGTHEEVPFSYHKTIGSVIEQVKKKGYAIYSLEETVKSNNFFEEDLEPNCAFIFGHEITGVSPVAIQESKSTLMLPMLGKKNSLNVSTTVGIVLYNYKFTL